MLAVNPSSLLQKQKPKGPALPLEDEGCCGIFFPMQQQGIKIHVFQIEGSRNSSTSSLNMGCFLQISIQSLHSPSHLTPLSTYALTVIPPRDFIFTSVQLPLLPHPSFFCALFTLRKHLFDFFLKISKQKKQTTQIKKVLSLKCSWPLNLT